MQCIMALGINRRSKVTWTVFKKVLNKEIIMKWGGGNKIVLKFMAKEKCVWKFTQLTFTCSKSTRETLEKGVKYLQS